jgi:hypothetical protein
VRAQPREEGADLVEAHSRLVLQRDLDTRPRGWLTRSPVVARGPWSSEPTATAREPRALGEGGVEGILWWQKAQWGLGARGSSQTAGFENDCEARLRSSRIDPRLIPSPAPVIFGPPPGDSSELRQRSPPRRRAPWGRTPVSREPGEGERATVSKGTPSRRYGRGDELTSSVSPTRNGGTGLPTAGGRIPV